MSNGDLISIVMPVRNEEKFLVATLESIIAQTHQNFELIAIDDYSTDQSYQLLCDFAQRDDRITLLKNRQKGIIGALQLGIAKSRGDFVTRMDADDLMVEDKLEVMYGKLKSHGFGHLAVGKVSYFSESKEINEGYRNYETWLNSLTEQGANFEDIYAECSIPSPCWMLHRLDFEKCGGFSHYTYPEDYDLAFRMMAAGLRVIPEEKILHQWRDHYARTSRNDSNYSDNTFIPLKVSCFLNLHQEKNVAVWGAGRKGKQIVKELIHNGIIPSWYCNNENKIGKTIYEIKMQSEEKIEEVHKNLQIIVAVANPNEKITIEKKLKELGGSKNKDFFFFV